MKKLGTPGVTKRGCVLLLHDPPLHHAPSFSTTYFPCGLHNRFWSLALFTASLMLVISSDGNDSATCHKETEDGCFTLCETPQTCHPLHVFDFAMVHACMSLILLTKLQNRGPSYFTFTLSSFFFLT